MIPPLAIAFLVLGCVTILTNCTFMVVIWRNKKLHTATNWLLFSLCISDMCVGGLSAPFLGGLITLKNIEVGRSSWCLVLAVSLLVFPCISLAHLGVVTTERYITIIYPLRSLSIVTIRRIVYAIVLCWAIPVTLFSSTPWAWSKMESNIWNASNFRCMVDFVVPCYVFDSLLAGVVAVYILSTVMYVRIFAVALSQARRVAAEQRFGGRSQTRMSLLRSHLRGAFLVFVTIGVFAVSYFPLMLTLSHHCSLSEDAQADLIWQIFSFLSFFNSAVNPLIYGLGNRTIRQSLFNGSYPCRKNSIMDIASFRVQ